MLVKKRLIAAAALLLIGGAANAGIVELAVNGGFETGDFTGWSLFPVAGTTLSVVTTNPSSGTYAGNLNVPLGAGPANPLIKQANLAEGLLTAGQSVDVSFDVRGSFGEGGVLFAENFSEISGGGVSFNDLLVVNGSVNPNPDVWTTFSYTTVLGPDVSGGFTLQLAAVCGPVAECFTDVFIDNVSITANVVPIPAVVDIVPGTLHPRHDGSGDTATSALLNDVIPVVVFGASTLVGDPEDLDTDLIDPATLAFGPGMGGISPSHPQEFNLDVDSDGLDDARFRFLMGDAAFDKVTCSDDTGTLVGELTTGETFEGADTFISNCNASCH